MLVYSPEAEPGRAYLLRQYNDVDIFVEDVASQNAYVRLFGRILEGRARISNVFPLHDRARVLDACLNDQSPRPRRRLYVIDADFDLLHGTPAPTLAHLHRLNVYCSENLMFSEAALIEIAMECSTDMGWHDLALSLGLRDLFESAVRLLLPLFVVYAVAEWLDCGVTTCKYPVQRLFSVPNDPSSLSAHLIRKRISEVRTAILTQIDLRTYRSLRDSFSARTRAGTGGNERFISGKTYLLPLLYLHLKRMVGYQGKPDTLKVRLAARCEIDVDQGLVNALHALVN